MEETFKFLLALRVRWERSWRKCNRYVSFLLTEPCYGRLISMWFSCILPRSSQSEWITLITDSFMNGHVTQGCPSLGLFCSTRMGRNQGGKREWEVPTILPSHRIWSCPNWNQWFSPPWVRANGSEIVTGQTFKRKSTKIVFLFTTSSTLHFLEEAKHM